MEKSVLRIGVRIALSLSVGLLTHSAHPADDNNPFAPCKNPPKDTAQGGVDLSPRGITKNVDWGIRQGQRIASANLPGSNVLDDQDGPVVIPFFRNPNAPLATINSLVIGSIAFDPPRVKNCHEVTSDVAGSKTSDECDIILTISDFSAMASVTALPRLQGAQKWDDISIHPRGKIQVRFKGRLNPGANDPSQRIEIEANTVEPSLGLQGFRDFSHPLIVQQAPTTKLSDFSTRILNAGYVLIGPDLANLIVKKAIMPSVVKGVNPFVQKDLPGIHTNLKVDVPLFHLMDVIALKSLDDRIAAKEQAIAKATQLLRSAQTPPAIEAALKSFPSPQNFAPLFSHVTDLSSVQAAFAPLKQELADAYNLLDEKSKLPGIGQINPALGARIMNNLEDLERAEAQVGKNNEDSVRTVGLHLAAGQATDLQGTIAALLATCVQCAQAELPGTPSQKAPQPDSDFLKAHDGMAWAGYETLNGFLKYYYDQHGFDLCVDRDFKQPCSPLLPPSQQVHLNPVSAPMLQWRNGHLHLIFPKFRHTHLMDTDPAGKLVSLFEGADFRVTVDTSKDNQSLTAKILPPAVFLQPNDDQKAGAEGLLTGPPMDRAFSSFLTAALKSVWAKSVDASMTSPPSPGIRLFKAQLGPQGLLAYVDTNLPDVDIPPPSQETLP